MSTAGYRPEIDGLRAIAVLAVVLFHAHVPGFGGGYIGVDVFFVISGYLITGILQRELQGNRFSLARFYERRIRRIFPALFVVLAVSLGLAAWMQFPDEFASTGTSLVATSLFLANYHFMGDTGYFATAAHSKPLLHMWSLAVEEQYYVVFPLLLAAVWRRLRSDWLLGLMVLTGVASFAYAVWLLQRSPDAAYYSAPARAWQLMAGSVLALSNRGAPRRAWLADTLGAAGLAAVLLPMVLYSQSTPFPGWAALAPTLGAVALLWSTQGQGGLVRALLCWLPLRGVGLISFSLYLWHWPVLLFTHAWSGFPPDPLLTTASLVLTLVLAWASWRWVEQPARHWQMSRKQVLLAGGVCMVLGTGAGLLVRQQQGWPQRWSPDELALLDLRDDAPKLRDCVEIAPKLTRCALGVPGVVPSFVLWGDSHAEAISPALDAAASSRGLAGWLLTRGGCPPLLGIEQAREGFTDCSSSAEAALRWIAEQPDLSQLWLAGRWALYWSGQRFRREQGAPVQIVDSEGPADNAAVFERGVRRSLQRLHTDHPSLQILWVDQVAEAELRVPEALARAGHLNRALDPAPATAAYLERQAGVRKALANLTEAAVLRRVDPAVWLCDASRCAVQSQGLPLYRDSNHLTASAARGLGPHFAPYLENARPFEPAPTGKPRADPPTVR